MSLSGAVTDRESADPFVEAVKAAVLTALLCVPIILFHAEADNDGVLYLIWRPWMVVIFAAIAFLGRLAFLSWSGSPVVNQVIGVFRRFLPYVGLAVLFLASSWFAILVVMGEYASDYSTPVRAAAAVAVFAICQIPLVLRLRRREEAGAGAAPAERSPIAMPLLGLAFLLVFPIVEIFFNGNSGSLKWIDSYGIQILIYVMLGWGLNIVVGLAGLLDLGYVAFYAVGAYSYSLLATTYGLSFWICLPLAGILAALWGMILGFPVLRLRGDYLAIVTLAFGEIIRTVLVNWRDFSGGTAGIASIPKITFFGLRFADSDKDGFDHFFHMDYAPIHGKIFL